MYSSAFFSQCNIYWTFNYIPSLILDTIILLYHYTLKRDFMKQMQGREVHAGLKEIFSSFFKLTNISYKTSYNFSEGFGMSIIGLWGAPGEVSMAWRGLWYSQDRLLTLLPRDLSKSTVLSEQTEENDADRVTEWSGTEPVSRVSGRQKILQSLMCYRYLVLALMSSSLF